MRLTAIPSLVTAMVALCLFSVFDSAPAWADFSFGEPVNAGPIVNSAYADQLCCISPDGLEMYIESNRPPGGWCMWVSKRAATNEDWGIPVRLGLPVNVVNGDGWTCLSADGLSLYVMSSRPGGYGGWDIWMIKRPSKDDPWGEAVNLGTPVNTALHDEAPWISQDGLVLYFSREDNALNTDIRMSTRSRETDPWGEPVKLFPALTTANEGFPCVSSDGLMLLFADRYDTRARPGGYGNGDLWMSRRAGTADAWATPVNLGPNVNSAYFDILPRLSPDGRTLYFSVLNRPRGYGGWDIWQAPLVPIVDFNADGKVDLDDLRMLIDNWGTDNALHDIGPYAWGDGKVDIDDLKAFIAEWEKDDLPTQP